MRSVFVVGGKGKGAEQECGQFLSVFGVGVGGRVGVGGDVWLGRGRTPWNNLRGGVWGAALVVGVVDVFLMVWWRREEEEEDQNP